ncbi:hypothetical protein AKJ43_02045 [candidate division MSBL1 archaeon SCGC-AAA261D19]|uniref:Uncharacterized protein n=1 Tax=candidate division MSBL1 archaeon SCGC-AAA261D19 TaxID=1698273 RepID=A0A133V764_9EURY|nr:hypothetical protein AKJ43_02045 [candidate division MSBL1 archaeon SCGC-AAA261D19]
MTSSQEKAKPTSEDYIAPDANCCIISVVNFEELPNYFASCIIDLLKDCYNRNIPVVYFDFIKEESLKNVAKEIRNIVEMRKSHSKNKRYFVSKYTPRAKKRLKKKFEKWKRLDSPLDSEIENLREFFEEHKKEIVTEGGRRKKSIPDENDMRLIEYLNQSCCEKGFIVSQDYHFKGYSEEIENVLTYDIIILPLEDLTQIRIAWNWI